LEATAGGLISFKNACLRSDKPITKAQKFISTDRGKVVIEFNDDLRYALTCKRKEETKSISSDNLTDANSFDTTSGTVSGTLITLTDITESWYYKDMKIAEWQIEEGTS
jgi:hypothetical protein